MPKFTNEIRAQLVGWERRGGEWKAPWHDEDWRQFSYNVPNYDLLKTACDELLDYIAQRTENSVTEDYKDKFIQNLHEVVKQHNRIVISEVFNSQVQQISAWVILRATAQQVSAAFDMTFEAELTELKAKHG